MALLGPAGAALGSTVAALRGKSAQRLPVSLSAKKYLRAEHARGRVFRLTARLTCSQSGIPSRMTEGPVNIDVVPDRHGSFSATTTFTADDFPAHASVSGRIRGHEASGTLRVTTTPFASSVPNGIPCNSGRVKWKAS